MTGQDLLDYMETLDQELQLQSGEDDVTRGLQALNIAQDWFETVAATVPGFKGDTLGTVQTASSTEATAFPSGLLRLDGLQMLDATTSLPIYDLEPIDRRGGHRKGQRWPFWAYGSNSSTGKPTRYWTNGANIYWDPLPDGIHTIRWYGFQRASAISAGGTFAYDDIVGFAVALFACRIIKTGLEDSTGDLLLFAEQTFRPVIKMLGNITRDRAPEMVYKYPHTT